MDVGEAGDAGDVVPSRSPVAESFPLSALALVAVASLVLASLVSVSVVAVAAELSATAERGWSG